MEKYFKLKEKGTNVRTEILAGITTFITMVYIIFVNPSILSDPLFILGNPDAEAIRNSVFTATCIAAAIGTLMMAFIANLPFAQAPGMGLNAFFAVCTGVFQGCSSAGFFTTFWFRSWKTTISAHYTSEATLSLFELACFFLFDFMDFMCGMFFAFSTVHLDFTWS